MTILGPRTTQLSAAIENGMRASAIVDPERSVAFWGGGSKHFVAHEDAASCLFLPSRRFLLKFAGA
jgi:hypothetical protein